MFADATPAVEVFAGWLAGPGVERGLLGPREVDRLWSRHVMNCAVLEPFVPKASSVCDLGAGAGLPGIVLALMRPDLRMTLLEPLLRRATFLEEVVADLDLGATSVVRARAEDYQRERPAHDVVVARAVAPIDRLAGWAMPLLRPGGVLLALKGSTAADEVAAAGSALDRLGLADREVVTVGEGADVTQVVRIVRSPGSARESR
ncbi:MAG: 16S rRNA (guanine(527)-N(7))-methyltransferase RsmG [Actinomycetes bacterium]